ncbi:MAG: SusC/RagA family TonB-linked outer membrane protein [Gemmatimonadota bacterium]|nr:SusC/RagA family TonB-linked outer membrane protein [Gemmatimonadota bacterium]
MTNLSQSLRWAAARLLAPLTLACTIASALSLLPSSFAGAQGTGAGTVTGVVTADAGQPVVGAQVIIPGRGIGATTGPDGRFTLGRVPVGTYQLRAQRIGFAPQTQQITVLSDQVVTANFQLQQVATSLTTQVVVGYTTQQRRDVSDAVAHVSGDEIKDQKVATLEEALRGRVPGVTIAGSGEPGRPAQVIIRGQNFISGSVSPLYVVDGMYLTENPNLNPDDVESIEVLKDASAAAQYGAQAANGVIVIRTKHGREGETRTELSSYYGYQTVPHRIDLMNAAQWAAITQQSYAAAGVTPPPGVLSPQGDTDWQNALFQSGSIQDHNLSLSGGSAGATYLLSGGYLEQKGTILATGFKRYSFRINSEARRGRVTLGENVALSQSRRTNLNGFPLIDAMRMFPTIPVYDPANVGGYGYGTDANPTFGTNPVGQQLARNNTDRSNQVIGSAYADVGLIADLHYRFNLGVNYANNLNRNYSSIAQLRYRSPMLNGATLSEQTGDFTSLLFENLLLYNGTFNNGMHKFNAAAGITSQKQDDHELNVFRQGFDNASLIQIDAGSTNGLNNRGFLIQNRLNAMLLRANYTLLDRYLFTGSVRRDGSSRFGPGNRYANFGAASVGWVLSDEGFYKSIPVLSGAVDYLKIRASTGTLGNQDIGDYQFSSPIIQNQNYLFGGTLANGATQMSLANPNIRWQSNKQTNIGLDFGLLDDRLTFTADHYVSTSDGLLVNVPIPWSLGSSYFNPCNCYPFVIPQNPVANAGSVRNTGFELNLAHHLDRSAFHLNSTVNFTTISNKVTALGNGGQPIYAGFANVSRTVVGRPIGEFYVYKTAGIFQTAAEVAAHPAQAALGAVPGDVIYVDLNGDGKLDDADRYAAGSGIPKWTGGLFFDGRFNAFDFGLNMHGSHGNKIFNVTRYWSDRTDDPQNHRAGYSPWTPQNPSNTTPRALWGPGGATNPNLNDKDKSDRWIEDGSYWRIQNLVLGYTLPSSFFSRAGFAQATPRIYLNIQNLHTFTSYSGYDPEILGQADPLARGIDDGRIYPNVRTISFGLDLRM